MSMKVALMPRPQFAGVNSAEDFKNDSSNIEFCSCETFDDAFLTPWPTDAHYCGYAVYAPDGQQLDEWPRINKGAVPAVRKEGFEVLTTLISLDWDTPNHMPWDKSRITQDQFVKALERAGKEDARLDDWSCMYFSKSGARIVYRLKEPMIVEQSELLSLAIRNLFDRQGLSMDEKCKDWTRIMRLPMVLRDNIRTEDQPYFSIDIQDRRLDGDLFDLDPANSIPEHDLGDVPATLGSMPTCEEARKLLEIYDGKKWTKTEYYRQAKKYLKGHNPLFDAVFNEGDLHDNSGPGCNTAITENVGRACALLVQPLSYVTAKHIFSLFQDSVSKFQPYKKRKNSQDWLMCLWDICCRIWRKEKAIVLAQKKQHDKVLTDTEEKVTKALAESVEWYNDPKLDNADAMEKLTMDGTCSPIEAIQSIAIAKYGRFLFPMKPNGKYSSKPVSSDGLIGEIRMLGSEPLIPLSFVDEQGKTKKRTAQNIIENHAVTITEIKKRFMSKEESGYIQGITSESPTLWFSLDSRNPRVTPRRSDSVEEWIRLLDPSGRLEEWLTYAPAADQGGICGLFMVMPPGSGKQLLVDGLSECFASESYAQGVEMVGDYQKKLAQTCVLHIDEQMPKGRSASHTPDAVFRNIITSGKMYINEKFAPLMEVWNSPRILGTANNPRMVSELFPSQYTEQDDRDAILERMLLITCDDKAARYLEKNGGMNFTGAAGKRWAKGKNGEPSDYILAGHIMWLWHNRQAKQGLPQGRNRLLVDGKTNDDYIQSASGNMNTIIQGNNEVHAAVSEALLYLFNMESRRKAQDPRAGGFIDYKNMKFWATAHGVREILLKPLADNYPRKPGTSAISAALRCLRTATSPKEPMVLEDREACGKVSWYDIDLDQLENYAQELGGECRDFQEFADDARIFRKEYGKEVEI